VLNAEWFTKKKQAQMIEKYGQEVSKRRQAKAAIVKLTDAKKNKG
tara:strand:+ start:447 stop:581 length:135 start_codon:yes stop_codon:yes gene_type:complete